MSLIALTTLGINPDEEVQRSRLTLAHFWKDVAGSEFAAACEFDDWPTQLPPLNLGGPIQEAEYPPTPEPELDIYFRKRPIAHTTVLHPAFLRFQDTVVVAAYLEGLDAFLSPHTTVVDPVLLVAFAIMPGDDWDMMKYGKILSAAEHGELTDVTSAQHVLSLMGDY